MVVVTIKYVVFIMRADNNGEGGVMALAALAHRSPGSAAGPRPPSASPRLLGLALFYGDGMLTPAISVLSARGRPGRRQRSLRSPGSCR